MKRTLVLSLCLCLAPAARRAAAQSLAPDVRIDHLGLTAANVGAKPAVGLRGVGVNAPVGRGGAILTARMDVLTGRRTGSRSGLAMGFGYQKDDGSYLMGTGFVNSSRFDGSDFGAQAIMAEVGQRFGAGRNVVYAGLRAGYGRYRGGVDGAPEASVSGLAYGPSFAARFGPEYRRGTVHVDGQAVAVASQGLHADASAAVNISRRLSVGVTVTRESISGPVPARQTKSVGRVTLGL